MPSWDLSDIEPYYFKNGDKSVYYKLSSDGFKEVNQSNLLKHRKYRVKYLGKTRKNRKSQRKSRRLTK